MPLCPLAIRPDGTFHTKGSGLEALEAPGTRANLQKSGTRSGHAYLNANLWGNAWEAWRMPKRSMAHVMAIS